MICRIGAVGRSGSAITVEQAVDTQRLVDAVRRRDQTEEAVLTAGGWSVAVECEPPTTVHEHIGQIQPGMRIRTRTALAAAGRTRGFETPHDDDIARLEDELASMSVGEAGLETRRRECADECDQRQRLQETVAATRGRLAACREHGLETDAVETELEAQIRQLAETETTATAAAQRHEQARTRARDHRDQRDRRMRLEDRLANRRRDARRWLVERVEAEFAAAVQAVSESRLDDPFDCQPVVAGLAVGRVAEYTAPLVLETAQFDSARAAADWLDGPVIFLR
jgi:hypothetical protein